MPAKTYKIGTTSPDNETKKDSSSVWHSILIGSGKGSNKYIKQQLEEGKYQKVKSAMIEAIEAMKIKSKKKKGKK
jgi:hypothetical protein